MPHDHPRLRLYPLDANKAVEQALAERRRHLLVAMATGTGKTFTIVNQIYRLMKAGVAKRVLFLVDRRALATQAVRASTASTSSPTSSSRRRTSSTRLSSRRRTSARKTASTGTSCRRAT
jgi:type I restriction enzyme R subunit